MAYDTLLWLQDWFLSQCDGDWEHQQGVRIETLDNPGWSVEIDLAGAQLEGASFDRIQTERSEHDWLSCDVTGGKFKAACGPSNLVEVIEAFRSWAGGHAIELFEKRKISRLGR
jgi:hypothetical protein